MKILLSSFGNSLLSLSTATKARLILGCFGAGELGFLALAEKPWHVESGENRVPRLAEHVAVFSWIAALINLFVLGLLAATAGWWTRSAASRLGPRSAPPRWFWPAVLGAMAVTAAFSLPRLNHSLWDDEEYNVRHSILGRFQTADGSGHVKFREAKWMDTLYDYREPNNHVFHSILARISLTGWRAFVRPADLPFAEWPLRIPTFLFGVASIGALAWFVKEFFGPRAGVFAAFLMAVHPWLIRYASEARGYSMVLCVLPVAFVLWHRCVTEGDWKWWAGYALAQWVLLYTYPGVLFVVVMLNLLAIPLLYFSSRAAGPFVVQSGRWFASNCVAAMACLQLMLPLYPQAKAYFAYESARNFTLGWSWVQNTLSFLLAGASWSSESPAYPSLAASFSSHPWMVSGVVGLALGLVLLGFLRFFTKGPTASVVALAIVLPPLMTLGVSLSRKHLIYSSYVIYMLPGLVAFAAAGLAWVAGRAGRLPAGRYLSPAIPVILLAGFFLMTSPTRDWLVGQPLQPIKDSVLASRKTLDPWGPENQHTLSASFSIPPFLYDGNVLRVDSADEFISLLERADRENRRLVINIGMPWAARAYSPKMWAMLNEPELFQERLHLRGFDSGLDRIVATYIPGSAANFDFTEYAGPDR